MARLNGTAALSATCCDGGRPRDPLAVGALVGNGVAVDVQTEAIAVDIIVATQGVAAVVSLDGDASRDPGVLGGLHAPGAAERAAGLLDVGAEGAVVRATADVVALEATPCLAKRDASNVDPRPAAGTTQRLKVFLQRKQWDGRPHP